MSKTVEIIKALSEPTMKLMDMVGSAIGTAYEPRHKRKMADATAYEISVVGDAMRNAADLPVLYNQEGVVINSEDFNRLMQRAGTRLALQETIKQYNIESVVDNAYDILEKEDHCSSEPVDQGWINRFFDSVADVADDDLQHLWGKVLAGEVKQPHTYSLRTLETLKNLSKHEAQLFQKILPFVVEGDGESFVTSKSSIYSKYGITYDDIMLLDECGLIVSDGMISTTVKFSHDSVIIHNKNYALVTEGIKRETSFTFGVHCLTNAGRELLSILEYESNNEFFVDFVEYFFKENKHSKMKIKKIKSINGDIIHTTGETIREFNLI